MSINKKTGTISAANRLGLDYHQQALETLGKPPCPIIDIHTHINGTRAARLYKEIAEIYGIQKIYSMSQLENIPYLKRIFGDKINFIAVPNYNGEDLTNAFTTDWLDRIPKFAEHGSKICKFWCAPRSRDYEVELGIPDLFAINGQWRKTAMKIARDCGMMFMTHIADPDTWFSAKYTNKTKYGTKLSQYQNFEKVLDESDGVPWIAAHMGGYPENLEFLDNLLTQHDNLYFDTSATKWMVRELSQQPRSELVSFLERWQGRIMFGSDIVTMDDHLNTTAVRPGISELAATKEEAFDLYASRYWALRTLFETDYAGPSPIADPDLNMVNPEKYTETDSPQLTGKSIPQNLLKTLYHDAADTLINNWSTAPK